MSDWNAWNKIIIHSIPTEKVDDNNDDNDDDSYLQQQEDQLSFLCQQNWVESWQYQHLLGEISEEGVA